MRPNFGGPVLQPAAGVAGNAAKPRPCAPDWPHGHAVPGQRGRDKAPRLPVRPSRLDAKALGGQDAYPHLQRIGILSQVDHEFLPGSDIRLSAEELKRLKEFRRLPDAARRRLAADAGRNRTLLESILPSTTTGRYPVRCLRRARQYHGRTLVTCGYSGGGHLGRNGKGVRRHYIDRFRRGRVRVLTNYNVLAAGFDTPRVRAVYIARPTYAPNRYQQMIGRGLRGPRTAVPSGAFSSM